MRPVFLSLVCAVALGGCARLADSRLNPVNWFASGGGAAVASDPAERRALVPADAVRVSVDARLPVTELLSASLDRTSGGAILRATGRTDSPGWFNAELVLVNVEGRTATYAFRADPPRTGRVAGGAGARLITAAKELTVGELSGLAAIRVQGATGSRTIRP